MTRHVDHILFVIVCILVIAGFFIFSSASLGLLARQGASFSSVAFTQVVFGIGGGSIAMFLMSQFHYKELRKYAFYIFIFTVFLTLLVFVPHVGFAHGGARRWVNLGHFTMQPSEFLKLGFIIFMATWLSSIRKDIKTFRRGALPFMLITGAVAIMVLLQPDTDAFLLTAVPAFAMYVVAGGRGRDIGIMIVTGILLLAVLVMVRPYLRARIQTYLHPSHDVTGQSYQVEQSLIAIGNGGWFGRGYGQSIQKFNYLPEPIGDSIFAVFGEEFGFLGCVLLVSLLSFFTFRGYKIASHAPDLFGMLLVVGIMTMIVLQAYLNIAAMLAIAPLTGVPLPFISHGGTALLTTLTSVGVVLNVSKYQRQRV